MDLKMQARGSADDRPAFPALCMYDDHVSLLWPAGSSLKRFTYKELEKVFDALQNNDNTTFAFAYAHAATKAEKKVRQLTKEVGELKTKISEMPKYSKGFAAMMYKYR